MVKASNQALARSAWWLGWVGVIPFVAGALTVSVDAGLASGAARAVQGYGAAILSFLGGVHWGLVMVAEGITARGRGALLAIATVPALIAWAALMLPIAPGVFVLAGAFALPLLVDRHLISRRLAPQSWWALRVGLTAVVVAALATAGVAAIARGP